MDTRRIAFWVLIIAGSAGVVGCAASSGTPGPTPEPIASAVEEKAGVNEGAEADSAEVERVNAYLDGLEEAFRGVGSSQVADASDTPAWAERALGSTLEGGNDVQRIELGSEEPEAGNVEDGMAGSDTAVVEVDPGESGSGGVELVRVDEPTIDEQYRRALSELARLTEIRAYEPETAETGFTTRVRQELLRGLGWDGDALDAGLTASERERAIALSDSMTTLRSVLDGGALLPLDLDSALGRGESLSEIADMPVTLGVPVIELCERVRGFGVYETLPKRDGVHRFRAGVGHRVIVYAELDNVVSERASSSLLAPRRAAVAGYRSSLEQTVELYFDGTDRLEPSSDVLVWSAGQERIEDFARSERSDFFTAQAISLPRGLSVGRYSLKLTVRDRVGGGVSEAVLPIEVVVR